MIKQIPATGLRITNKTSISKNDIGEKPTITETNCVLVSKIVFLSFKS